MFFLRLLEKPDEKRVTRDKKTVVLASVFLKASDEKRAKNKKKDLEGV